MDLKWETAGSLVRRHRLRLGLSQNELADRAGVPRGWLSVVELDRVKKPEVFRLRSLARVLELDPNTLLSAAGYPVVEPASPRRRTLRDIARELTALADELETARARESADERRTGYRVPEEDVYSGRRPSPVAVAC